MGNGVAFLLGLGYICASYAMATLLQIQASRDNIPDLMNMILSAAISLSSLVVPCLLMLVTPHKSILSGGLVFLALIAFMKILSYCHVNRRLQRAKKLLTSNRQDGDDGDGDATSPVGPDRFPRAWVDLYPANLSLKDMAWYAWVPTLSYQAIYPMTPCVDWKKVKNYAGAIMIVSSFLLMLTPLLSWRVNALHAAPSDSSWWWAHPTVVQCLIHISCLSAVMWILGGYTYFDLLCNLLAEVSMHGGYGYGSRYISITLYTDNRSHRSHGC